MKLYKKILTTGIIIAFLPFIILLFFFPIVKMTGCDVDMYAPKTCLILGVELGEFFYSLQALPFFSFITFPVGVVIMVIGLFTKSIVDKKDKEK